MKLFTGGIYHIYNRGVDKRDVFLNKEDYIRFLTSLRKFNYSEPAFERPGNSLVDIICYCLNPNHFHLLVKQSKDGGITRFMQRVGNGYTQYFNLRYKRSGSLFQGRYKAALIKSEERYWQASFYINGNYEIHGQGSMLEWPWSSCFDYIGKRQGTLCSKEAIMADFSGADDYRNLLAEYVRDKKEWKRADKLMEN